jgi:ribosomal protein L37AE/L43A
MPNTHQKVAGHCLLIIEKQEGSEKNIQIKYCNSFALKKFKQTFWRCMVCRKTTKNVVYTLKLKINAVL